MLLTAFLKPAKDMLAVLLLALGDQAALSLSRLYARDFRARLDSVDEVEERSDLSDFAAALRESVSDCGYGGTEASFEAAGSGVADFGFSSAIESRASGAESREAMFGSYTREPRASVNATTGRDSCRYRSGNRSVLPSRLEVPEICAVLLESCLPSRRVGSVTLRGAEKGRYVEDANGEYCVICGPPIGTDTGGCLPVILKRSKSLYTLLSFSSP